MKKYFEDGVLILTPETPWPAIKEYLQHRVPILHKELEGAASMEKIIRIQGKLELIRELIRIDKTAE